MQEINALGKACPLPVIETKNALKTTPDGTVTLVDNEIAVQNLTKLAAQLGMTATSAKTDAHVWQVTITPAATAAEDADCPVCQPMELAPAGPSVVVLGSDCMGSGNDELGAALMKGFVYALTQLDKLPDTVLLFNGGAKLSCKGAVTVQDLKDLEQSGVEILTCGTCLNFYGLSEQLAVGSVTNMYEICSRMAAAGTVIRP